jgi:hypothetical protein
MQVITRASEHVANGALDERYCTIADVRHELRGVAIDNPTNNQDLGAWLSSTERNDVLLRALVDARMWVDDKTKRDFDYHKEVMVAVDGSGEDVLNLASYGFLPLYKVSFVEIDGRAHKPDKFALYPSTGRVKAKSYGQASRYASRGSAAFPIGAQNVVLSLTWGYQHIPRDIVVAQARKAAALVLDQLERADLSTGDVSPGFREVNYGDVKIRMGDYGRYGLSIRRLEEQALETCMRYRIPLVESARSMYRGKPSQPGG